MAKSKAKTKAREKKPMDPATVQRIRAVLKHTTLVVLFIATCGAGAYLLYGNVEKKIAFPTAPPVVVLKNRPAWMSDFLAEQIIKSAQPLGTHSSFSHQMLVDADRALQANPWIRKVNQLRRVYGKAPGDTLEIDCEYRTPLALVHWGEYYWLLDDQGYKLPEQYTSQQVPRIVVGHDRKMNIRIIEGIKQPPPESGAKWIGEDLAAGMEMVKLLLGQPYAEEIVKVDVSNFAGRKNDRESHIVLVTQYGSEVRWGRQPSAPDFFVEIPTAQKLARLDQLRRQEKRVDAGYPWVDIRSEIVTFPGDNAHADARN